MSYEITLKKAAKLLDGIAEKLEEESIKEEDGTGQFLLHDFADAIKELSDTIWTNLRH